MDRLKPSNSTEQTVVHAVMDFVRHHQLEPGDKLPSERDLAARFGVGRNSIREAIVTLTTLRVLETRRNSGIYLRRMTNESSFETLLMLSEANMIPSADEIRESIEVREILELRAIELACARRTKANIDALLAVNEETRKAASSNINIVDLDTRFHIELASSAHNQILVKILNSFYILSAPRRKVIFADRKRANTALQEHEKIVEALNKKDAKKAKVILAKHIDRARHYWAQLLPAAKS